METILVAKTEIFILTFMQKAKLTQQKLYMKGYYENTSGGHQVITWNCKTNKRMIGFALDKNGPLDTERGLLIPQMIRMIRVTLSNTSYVTSTTCLSSSVSGAKSFSRLMMRPDDTQRPCSYQVHWVISSQVDSFILKKIVLQNNCA